MLRVCFIGHRKVVDKDSVRQFVFTILEKLLRSDCVIEFLFGSRSEFDSICHFVVSDLQKKYPKIKRLVYACRSEAVLTKEEKEKLEKNKEIFPYRGECLQDYDGEIEYRTKYSSGRASYVERNKAMIDDSDICIFYYNPNYLPPRRGNAKRDSCTYQPKSGTHIAYDYAMRQKKEIVNVIIK